MQNLGKRTYIHATPVVMGGHTRFIGGRLMKGQKHYGGIC